MAATSAVVQEDDQASADQLAVTASRAALFSSFSLMAAS
jgi:hypothetical protein